MSFDEIFLCRVVKCLKLAKIDHVVIGATAAILHGVPIMTQDVDVFVRDTDVTRKKIRKFAEHMGNLILTAPGEPMSKMIRAIGAEIPVDFVFNLSSGKSFESVRSRSISVAIGQTAIRIASLEDIIDAKQAAARKKDLAVLGMMQDTLRVKIALGNSNKNRSE